MRINVKMKKLVVEVMTIATIFVATVGPCMQTHAAAPGAGKQYADVWDPVNQCYVPFEPKQGDVIQQPSIVEEPVQEEPIQEEKPAQEEAEREESVLEEAEQEESAQEEAEQEKPAQEVPAQEVPAQKVPAQEEATQELPQQEETAHDVTKQENLPQEETEQAKEATIDETYTVEAPQRIYNVDWSISPNDWTYTETEWTDGTATVEGHYGSQEEIQRMYELVNAYRIANGKEALTYNTKMDTCSSGAYERAVTSANYWEHWSYRFSENIAYTPVFYSEYSAMEMVEKVFEAWINSDGHRNNILNAGSTHHETAISVFYKKVDGGYERYWVQCFR